MSGDEKEPVENVNPNPIPDEPVPEPKEVPAPKTMQQPVIVGYRQLTDREAAMMNAIKNRAEQIGNLVYQLEGFANLNAQEVDPRWVAIGKSDLQKGFMALVRAVAKPTTF